MTDNENFVHVINKETSRQSSCLAMHHMPSGSQTLCHNLLILPHRYKVVADLKFSELPLREMTCHHMLICLRKNILFRAKHIPGVKIGLIVCLGCRSTNSRACLKGWMGSRLLPKHLRLENWEMP